MEFIRSFGDVPDAVSPRPNNLPNLIQTVQLRWRMQARVHLFVHDQYVVGGLGFFGKQMFLHADYCPETLLKMLVSDGIGYKKHISRIFSGQFENTHLGGALGSGMLQERLESLPKAVGSGYYRIAVPGEEAGYAGRRDIRLMPKVVSSFGMTQRQKLIDKARNNPAGVQRPHPPICIGGNGPKRTLAAVAKWAQHWNYAAMDVAADAGETNPSAVIIFVKFRTKCSRNRSNCPAKTNPLPAAGNCSAITWYREIWACES